MSERQRVVPKLMAKKTLVYIDSSQYFETFRKEDKTDCVELIKMNAHSEVVMWPKSGRTAVPQNFNYFIFFSA